MREVLTNAQHMLTMAIQSDYSHMEFVRAANCLVGWFPSRFTYQMLRTRD
jgi:hypothetical protein